MILLNFYDGESGQPVEEFTVNNLGAAQDACKAYAVQSGRSAFYECDASAGGSHGGFWHDGERTVFTPSAGPSRTARERVPHCHCCQSHENLTLVAAESYVYDKALEGKCIFVCDACAKDARENGGAS